MNETIDVDLLNEVSEDVQFLEAKISGNIGIFLIDEKYTGGSVWQVPISDVDFKAKEDVKKFLEESENLGESESFEDLADAKELYSQID